MKKLFTSILLLLALNLNAQWVQSSSGMGTDKFASSFLVNANIILTGTTEGVYRSTNFGTSWNPSSTTVLDVYCLREISSTIYMGAQTGIYTSVNNGLTWSPTSLTNRIVRSICDNGSFIFAGTDSGVIRSSNNGVNWTRSLNDFYVYSLLYSNGILFAGTGNYSPTGLYTSTNNGLNWNQTTLNNKNVTSLGKNNYGIFAGTSPSGVYLSTNNGLNWNQTTLNNKEVYSLLCINENVFAGTNSGVYLSTNNGGVWLQINEGLTGISDVMALIITNNYIFAARWNSSVWKRLLSELITSTKTISLEMPNNFYVSQNYPNPFNPVTNIKFAIPKSTGVKITVFDVAGKEVSVLVNERMKAGTYQTDWDAKAYPSGVYFYRMVTDGYSETRKMMLLK